LAATADFFFPSPSLAALDVEKAPTGELVMLPVEKASIP
jgi:hypothetical protein